MSGPPPATVRRVRQRAHIELADDVLMPRREFAEDVLHVSDKTAMRMNLPTTYIGNVAHILKKNLCVWLPSASTAPISGGHVLSHARYNSARRFGDSGPKGSKERGRVSDASLK